MQEKETDKTLELRFDSCSGIIIPWKAVRHIELGKKTLVEGEDDAYDLESFRVVIDLNMEDEFETYQYEETVEARKETLREFHECSDITHIYIDGKEYRPIWKPGAMYTNPWQENHGLTTSMGDNELFISIAERSDEVSIYARAELK